MVSRYNSFVESFSGLSPFQLSHLSEVLLCKIESRLEGRLRAESSNLLLDEGDIKVAFVEMMKAIVIEISKIQIAHQETMLAQQLYGMIETPLVGAAV